MIGAKYLISEPRNIPLIGAGARHHELLEQRLVPNAHALLHVGHFGLRLGVPCAGFISEKIAPVTVTMIAVDTSSSMSV